MKFLCDNCKAKYQIADDKVAGKTVRMKCRKCGHLIEIRASAALAEATAFRSLPAEELSRILEEPAKPTTGAPAAAPAPRPAAGSAAPKPAAAPAPSAGARKPGAAPAPAPRPGAGASPVRSLGPAATKGATALARAPEPEPAADEKPAPSTGGLATAFSQAVGSEADDAASSSFDMGAGTADEWYSGINGVPVGPMRLSELRSKIAAGLVTEESLVWREGFEEWVALRTVPALVEMARSSLPGERLAPAARRGNSVRTGPAGNVVSIRPEAGKSDPRVAAAAAASSAPPPAAAAAEEPNDDATNIFSGAALGAAIAQADAAAAAAAATPEPPTAPAPPVASVSVSDPFAAPASPLFAATPAVDSPPAAPAPVAASSFEPVMPAAEPARAPTNRIPPMAWVVVALALAVGVVGGTMLVPKPAPEITVQTVVVEKAIQAPTPDMSAKTPADPTEAPTDPSASAKKVVVGPGPRTGPTSVAPPASVAALPALPSLPNAGGGASPLPGNTAPPPSSTETIPAGKLQEIVNGQRSSLRRVCWDPLVASGAVAGSVKASVNLTVVNGQVTSVSVSGGDARMSSCVQSRVRGWQFPTGFAPTTTSFVLAFVAQAQ